MFEIKFNDTTLFKNIIETVDSLVSEVNLQIDPENGLTIASMDLAHICLVYLNINTEDCEVFMVDDPIEIGVNLSDLVKILKRGKKNDSLTITHNEEERKLHIVFESSRKRRDFELTDIDLLGENLDMDSLFNMTFNNVTDIRCIDLEESAKDAEIYAEVLDLSVIEKDGEMTINFATSGNIGIMDSFIKKEILINKNFQELSTGIYAISYLLKILKAQKLNKQTTIYLQNDAPIRFDFPLMEESKLLFFLAPRVENEDDVYLEE